MQFEVFCYISMWNIKSLWSFFLAIFVISGIVSSSLWSESDSILAKQLIKVPYKMSLTFVKTTWRPESPWCSDIFRIPLALSPGGWPPRVTWVCTVCVSRCMIVILSWLWPVRRNVNWQWGPGPEVGDQVPLDDVALGAAQVQPRGGEPGAQAAGDGGPSHLDGGAHYLGTWNTRLSSLYTHLYTLVTCTGINSFLTNLFKHQNLIFPKLT